MKPIDQLKSVLAESGYDVINEDGYRMQKLLPPLNKPRSLHNWLRTLPKPITMPVIIKVVLIKRLKMGRN